MLIVVYPISAIRPQFFRNFTIYGLQIKLGSTNPLTHTLEMDRFLSQFPSMHSPFDTLSATAAATPCFTTKIPTPIRLN
jgi:hypothetical protein